MSAIKPIFSRLGASIRRQDARVLSGLKAGNPVLPVAASAGLRTPEHADGGTNPSIQAAQALFKPVWRGVSNFTPANFARFGFGRFFRPLEVAHV